MRKLTLHEYANENNIHINTARTRFNKGLIDGAVRDKFNKIVIYVDKTQEEMDLEEYNRIFGERIKEDAKIKKEIDEATGKVRMSIEEEISDIDRVLNMQKDLYAEHYENNEIFKKRCIRLQNMLVNIIAKQNKLI